MSDEVQQNTTEQTPAVTWESLDDAGTAKTRVHRVPLAVRIAGIAGAVVFAAATVVAGMNVAAITEYNQATATLNQNLKEATNASADLKALKVSQEQTDARFSDAQANAGVLFNNVKDAIHANAAISEQLTDRISKALADQQHAADAAAKANEDAADGDADNKTNSALTDEQRKQIEDMLKNNGSQDQNRGNSSNDSGKNTNSNHEIKPW
ncbi:cell surface protein [Bifidobacterium dolichotidis]|uniref:Cell surface protein n=1 Tax=Bifidobacterium dolichotidis TaxID=2306976 RepID=A0A430FPI0_9BIFI|nr:DUF6466 family protein [Bifidobacterium dolichotidis]RSX54739.1 cell surface protein [Bifidobacterium dolichotidis]